MQDNNMKEEMLKALKCLYLAVQEDIVKDVETKVMNYVTELEEKLKEKEEFIDSTFEEWADNDTKIEEMLEPILGKEFIEGDSFCVPRTVVCVEKLVERYNHIVERCEGFASKLYKTRGERNELRKELEKLKELHTLNFMSDMLPMEKLQKQRDELRNALKEAYVHNQNMHCYQTKGRLHDELNKQTIILRTAIKN